MSKYEYLKQLDVSSTSTVDYPIYSITVNGVSPVLKLASATEANKPYFNELLKRASKTAAVIRTGSVSSQVLEENREEDRELYPKFIMKGWDNMVDGDTGQPIKFSRSEAVEFLHALPDWLFDDMRNYCGNPANFTDTMDVKVQGKNSQGG